MTDLECSAVSDRERWEAEKRWRERELELRYADTQRARWSNPLIIAILSATIAAIANLALAFYNGISQRDLAASEARQNLIVEAIKTGGDVEKSKRNLKFLVDTKLLNDIRLSDDISVFIEKKTAPALGTPQSSSSPHYDFPVVNASPINPAGLDIDVFSCATGGSALIAATKMATDLATAADKRQRLGGEQLGRIRLTSGKDWESGNKVVGDAREMTFAKALAERAAKVSGLPVTSALNTENATASYLSIFFCGK